MNGWDLSGWDLNIWAVLVAAAANLGIGMVWYAIPAISRNWMREVGTTKEQIAANPPRMPFAMWAAATLVAAFALSYLSQASGAAGLAEGLLLGVWVGVCVTTASAVGKHAFARQSATLFLITEANTTLGIIVMSAIVTVWR